MLAIVLGLLVVGIALSAPLVGLLVRVGTRVGALDTPGAKGHEKELRPVPNIGGVGIFWASMGPIGVALAAVWMMPECVSGWVPSVAPHVEHARAAIGSWVVIAAGALAMHLMGLWDDRRAIRAWPKLLIQVGVALATTILSDVRLTAPQLVGGGEILGIACTVVWIVVVVNAVNFIDNMDGLAGGIGFIAAACFMVATILNGQWFIAAALALLAGSLAGFLVWNLPPARIFMGDGGSLYIGYMLACLTARTTFIESGNPDYALGTAWYGVLMPLLVLAIPVYDGVFVTIWRIRHGKSPFVGGHEHISHRLVRLGLSKRRAVGVIWLLTAVTSMSGIGLGLMRPWQAALVGLQLAAIVLVMLVLETSVSGDGSRR